MTNTVSFGCTAREIKQRCNKANNLVEATISSIEGTFHPFSSEISQYDWSLCERSTVLHRLCNKWHRPDRSMTDKLITTCYDNWVSFEDHLENANVLQAITFAAGAFKRHLWASRALIFNWCKSFRFAIKDCDLDFTPGETYFPSKGYTSVRQKLKNIEHWTVTWEAADDAAELIMCNRALLNMAYGHALNKGILMDDRTARHDVLDVIRNDILIIVAGARGSSVPKDNMKRRFINIEPMFNMLLQRGISHQLRLILKKQGNDLTHGQSDHQKMIADLAYATIDWSNASDSNTYELIQWMFPSSVFLYLDRYRSPTTTLVYPDGRVCEMVNVKLSAMGNGFTFEVMTMLLLAFCRVLDHSSRVYGDDVIIKAESSARFIGTLCRLGWSVNKEKTFLTGKFRESCGSFYHSDSGYIESFNFEFIENLQDLILTCNKLRRVKHVDPVLHTLHQNLLMLVPALCKGPIVPGPLVHQMWAETSTFKQRQSKDHRSKQQWNRYFTERDTCQKLWQKMPVALVYVPVFKNNRADVIPHELLEPFDIAFYVWTSRKSNDPIRGKGRWLYKPFLIFEDTSYVPISGVRQLRRSILVASRVSRKRLTPKRLYGNTYESQ